MVGGRLYDCWLSLAVVIAVVIAYLSGGDFTPKYVAALLQKKDGQHCGLELEGTVCFTSLGRARLSGFLLAGVCVWDAASGHLASGKPEGQADRVWATPVV